MPRKLYAFADRRGVIEFGAVVPAGTLPIGRDWTRRIRGAVEVVARLAFDNKTLLVPGVPEASDDEAALDALYAFVDQVQLRLSRQRETRA